MSRRSSAVLILVSLSMACATSPRATQEPATTPATQSPPPAAQATQAPTTAAFSPVGTFDYTAILPDGTASPGTFTITGSNGAWTGTITRTGETGATELTDISVDGRMVTARTMINEGQVTFYMEFDGPQFTGKWTIQGAEGAFNGRRR